MTAPRVHPQPALRDALGRIYELAISIEALIDRSEYRENCHKLLVAQSLVTLIVDFVEKAESAAWPADDPAK